MSRFDLPLDELQAYDPPRDEPDDFDVFWASTLDASRAKRTPAVAVDVDSRLETIAEWAEPNRKGVVCYVEDGRPRGFLLWDVWDRVDAARELIRAGEPASTDQLRALIG